MHWTTEPGRARGGRMAGVGPVECGCRRGRSVDGESKEGRAGSSNDNHNSEGKDGEKEQLKERNEKEVDKSAPTSTTTTAKMTMTTR